MLFREIIVVYSENHKKTGSALFGKNAELIVKVVSTYSYHRVLKD
jgi:hypothetical protein